MDHRVHGVLQARILEWVAFPFSGALPNPGLEPRSPILQADSSPVEPQGKPLLKILSEIGTDGVRLRVTKGLGAGGRRWWR